MESVAAGTTVPLSANPLDTRESSRYPCGVSNVSAAAHVLASARPGGATAMEVDREREAFERALLLWANTRDDAITTQRAPPTRIGQRPRPIRKLEQRVAQLDAKLERPFGDMERRFGDMERRLSGQTRWLAGILMRTVLGFLGLGVTLAAPWLRQ